VADLLVTGGAGFIGANFVRWWRSENPQGRVVVLDALTYAGNRANLSGIPDISFIHGDIRDFDLVRSLLSDGLDTIVHFAAESHVDRSIDGPDAFIDTNVRGTHTLLKAAKAVWLDSGAGRPHRFHHVSTDEVYGSLGLDDPAFHEATPYAPNSPYSASKAASDHLVRAYHHTYGLATTISNCSNNYGPYQFPEKLIPLFIINALLGKPLPVYGDGMNIRDWLHVEDHCRAIGQILAEGRAGETYNIGGRTELANCEVVSRICEGVDAAFRAKADLAGLYPQAPAATARPTAGLVTPVPDRLGHDRRYAVNTTKIEEELDFKWKFDFESGMAATLDWYLENQDWWRGSR
jgi:dTDP-glucose 4,6-dehydratase